jgi:hypothetical protein
VRIPLNFMSFPTLFSTSWTALSAFRSWYILWFSLTEHWPVLLCLRPPAVLSETEPVAVFDLWPAAWATCHSQPLNACYLAVDVHPVVADMCTNTLRRSHLGSFGIGGELCMQPMYTLSGGQVRDCAAKQYP